MAARGVSRRKRNGSMGRLLEPLVHTQHYALDDEAASLLRFALRDVDLDEKAQEWARERHEHQGLPYPDAKKLRRISAQLLIILGPPERESDEPPAEAHEAL